MMRRSPFTRVFAAALAPWLALVLAEPVGLHECAMHSGHGAPSAMAPATHAHGGHSGHASMPHAPPPDRHAAKYCTCLGGCCAAAPVALPADGAAVTVIAAGGAERPAAAPSATPRPSTEHLLPFANGPPSARA